MAEIVYYLEAVGPQGYVLWSGDVEPVHGFYYDLESAEYWRSVRMRDLRPTCSIRIIEKQVTERVVSTLKKKYGDE